VPGEDLGGGAAQGAAEAQHVVGEERQPLVAAARVEAGETGVAAEPERLARAQAATRELGLDLDHPST
jgi:hypothetical protein